jgi:hypothetical protein
MNRHISSWTLIMNSFTHDKILLKRWPNNSHGSSFPKSNTSGVATKSARETNAQNAARTPVSLHGTLMLFGDRNKLAASRATTSSGIMLGVSICDRTHRRTSLEPPAHPGLPVESLRQEQQYEDNRKKGDLSASNETI